MIERRVEDMTPEGELAALEELVTSDGWRVLEAHRAQAWGDAACLAKIDEALAKASTLDDELAITKRIRDTFKGVNAEAAWARRRITELKAAIKDRKATPTIVDRFRHLRRVP